MQAVRQFTVLVGLIEMRYSVIMMKSSRFLTVLCAGILLFVLTPAPRAHAQAGDAYALVDAVNALRAQYGLPPYQVNPSLMTAAQLHSEWAAGAGYHSHAGPDGSRPRDRAIQQGYGSGATVYVSENIYWSSANPTNATAVNWWTNSPIHFQGMTSDFYLEIGAGVAYNGSAGYFTLMFGVVSGQASSSAGSSAGQTAPQSLSDFGSGDVITPILVATPGPDGSVFHQVQEGQFLINIADAYGIELDELLAINDLDETSIIYPGDLVMITAPQHTPTPEPEPTDTPAASGGALPAGTATAFPTLPPLAGDVSASSVESSASEELQSISGDVEPGPEADSVIEDRAGWLVTLPIREMRIGFGVLVGCGLILMFLGFRLRHRRVPGDQDPAWYEWE